MTLGNLLGVKHADEEVCKDCLDAVSNVLHGLWTIREVPAVA